MGYSDDNGMASPSNETLSFVQEHRWCLFDVGNGPFDIDSGPFVVDNETNAADVTR